MSTVGRVSGDDECLVRLDVAGGVATITLDSPGNRNALSLRLVTDLVDALARAEASIDDAGTRSIVLTHSPPVFCAGADLKERARELPSGAERARELPSGRSELGDRIAARR